jgi:hypothetical protein
MNGKTSSKHTIFTVSAALAAERFPYWPCGLPDVQLFLRPDVGADGLGLYLAGAGALAGRGVRAARIANELAGDGLDGRIHHIQIQLMETRYDTRPGSPLHSLGTYEKIARIHDVCSFPNQYTFDDVPLFCLGVKEVQLQRIFLS